MNRRAPLIATIATLVFVGIGCKLSDEDLARKESCDKWPKFSGEYATCWSRTEEACVSFLPVEKDGTFQAFTVLDRKVQYQSEKTYDSTEAREKAMRKQMKKMRCL